MCEMHKKKVGQSLSGRELQITAFQIAAETIIRVLSEVLSENGNVGPMSLEQIEEESVSRIMSRTMKGRLAYLDNDTESKLRKIAAYKAHQLCVISSLPEIRIELSK